MPMTHGLPHQVPHQVRQQATLCEQCNSYTNVIDIDTAFGLIFLCGNIIRDGHLQPCICMSISLEHGYSMDHCCMKCNSLLFYFENNPRQQCLSCDKIYPVDYEPRHIIAQKQASQYLFHHDTDYSSFEKLPGRPEKPRRFRNTQKTNKKKGHQQTNKTKERCLSDENQQRRKNHKAKHKSKHKSKQRVQKTNHCDFFLAEDNYFRPISEKEWAEILEKERKEELYERQRQLEEEEWYDRQRQLREEYHDRLREEEND